MSKQNSVDRRGFLSRSVLAGAALGLSGDLWGWRAARGQTAPNERLGLAFIGIGGMGGGHLGSLYKDERFDVVALCDVDSNRLASASTRVQEHRGDAPFTTRDYLELLEQPGVDAVVISTPDHWHGTQAIHALRAGKHVYVEKPLTRDIEEGRLLVEEVAKSDCVLQVGTQQRSSRNFQSAAEIVRSGQLGEIKKAWAWKNPRWLNTEDAGAQRNRATPETLDWDRWLGPSPAIPFDHNRAHYAWRYFWDQGGGLMTDWGVHMLDIVLWAMQPERLISVEATGTRWEASPMEVPYTQLAHYELPGFTMQWQQGGEMHKDPEGLMNDHGIAFEGSEATLFVTRGRMPVVTPDTFELKEIPEEIQIPRRGSHYDDWVACIRDRTLTPLASAADVHWTSSVCTLGNVAYRVGGKLDWSMERERFADSQFGNYLIEHHPRAPYTLD